jgi:hypothetical protein
MTERDRRVVLPASTDFDQLLDVLTRLTAARPGAVDADVVPRVAELKACLAAIEDLGRATLSDRAARERAATELDKLIATMRKVEAMCHRIARRTGTSDAAAFRGVEFTRWVTGLEHFAQLLRGDELPAKIDEAELARVLDQVRAITGVVDPSTDPWADERTARELKAGIEADVKESLDGLFGDFSELKKL